MKTVHILGMRKAEIIDVPEPECPVCIDESESTLIIENGRLRIELRKAEPDCFASVEVKTDHGWRDLLSGGPCA